MRVLVTGGCGFIGSAVCRHLVNTAGAEVLNVDKLTYAASPTSLVSIQDSPSYSFLQADICDRETIRNAFDKFRPDAVMHLAAESHVDRSINGAAEFVNTNVTGTFVLLEEALVYWRDLMGEAKDHFRFLHISTDEVYGSLGDDELFTETTPYDPSSPYSASKAASDHLVMAWHRTYGLPTLISNCSNNYGPFHYPEKLIPLCILNAMQMRSLPVYGKGDNVRDWLYVEDHVRALMLILDKGKPGETYNVGGRNERKNIDVVEAICDCVDTLIPHDQGPRRNLIRFVADRPGHDHRYAIDPTKLERELGWRAEENFESGLEKTVRWYLHNPHWWEPLRLNYDGARLGVIKDRTAAGI